MAVPLLGRHHYGSGFRDHEVCPRHTDARRAEVWPRVFAHYPCEVADIFVLGIRPIFLREQGSNVVRRFLDRGADDVAWRLIIQLLDALTEVGLCDPDPSPLEERTQFAF